jgi:hypothetical protein
VRSRTEIVDWFHASEHIWTAAVAVQGDDALPSRAALASVETRLAYAITD